MRKRALLLGAVLALLAMADMAGAQTATGQITGTVKDATGAVVPGASVTVHSDLTGLTRTGATNPSGDYSFPLLPTGVYSVSAELTGFSVAKQSGIRLNVDQVARIDLTLAVGAGTETVEVKAATVALDTETATVGQVITEKQITDLPLNGRNFLSLLFLGAGAVETDRRAGHDAPGRRERDQPHGRPADLEQLHDRRDVERRHRSRHPGRRSCRWTPWRSSRSRPRPTRRSTASAPTRSTWSASPARTSSTARSSTSAGTRRSTRRTSSTPTTGRSPSWTRSSSAGRSAVRSSRTRPSCSSTTRARGSNGDPATFYIVPTADQLAGRFTTTIIDPLTKQPFPNNTIPAERFSRLAQLTIRNGWYPAPNTNAPQGNYPAGPDASPDAEPVHRAARPGPGPVRKSVCTLHEDDVREHLQRDR